MAIDLINHFKVWFSQFSNKSLIGELIANPLSLALIIVITLCIMIWSLSDDKIKSNISFKLVFYLFSLTVGLLLLHQNVSNQRFEEKYKLNQYSNQFNPRSLENLPEYVETVGAGPLNVTNGRNFPGYNNLVSSNQVPSISTSDDLLRFVQAN